MRRVVFIGNCQVYSLSQLYQSFSERKSEEQIVYLPSYEDLTDERAARVAEADIIVEQRMDVAPRADVGGIVSSAERYFVPLLAGGFLWPFAGGAHPRNEIHSFMPTGPFDGEMGDTYLNRLIDNGTAAVEAVDQYRALNVNSVRNLDRLFELLIDRQRSRDAACGYQIADLIEERFREEALFRTPYHPNLPLMLHLAGQFFQHFGMGEAAIKNMYERVRVAPMPETELPIHPAVARHFKLTYADAWTLYQIHDEGRFTFTEYALRYMRYDWNPDLAEGIASVGQDVTRALPKLEAGLERSSNSAKGWFSYAEALRRLGRAEKAETAIRRAIAINPMEGRHYHGLGYSLVELGRLDEAAQAAERAVAIDPFNQHYNALSASIAVRRGRLTEAEAFVGRAIEVEPTNPHLHRMLGDILQRLERHADAATAFQAAIEIEPDVAPFHLSLSGALARAGRMPEAIEAARRAAALEPDNAAMQAHLTSLLAQSGDPKDAEAGLRMLIAARPNEAGLYEQYGHLLARLGRPEEAEVAFRRGVELAPDAAGPFVGLSHTLARIGRHHEAIAAIEAAIEFEPHVPAFHVHHGNQLWVVEQYEEAAAAYQAALDIDPANRDAEQQLQGVRTAMRRAKHQAP
jgi:tetratricopeptide (TPR) repeat protein